MLLLPVLTALEILLTNSSNMAKQRSSSLKRKCDKTPPLFEPFEKAPRIAITSLKTMKKCDVITICEKLQISYDCALKEAENVKAQKIELEEKYTALESKYDALKKEQSEKPVYLCSDCEYIADCIHDFNDHTHSPEDFSETSFQNSNFNCNYCDEVFTTKSSLMQHTKESHREKVQNCFNYLDGSCVFGEHCWFIHNERMKETTSEIKCNYCEEKFKTLHHLMMHKKMKHIQNVEMCYNEKNNCHFGHQKCWFLHRENLDKAFENEKKCI